MAACWLSRVLLQQTDAGEAPAEAVVAEAAANATEARPVSTPEGMAVAYGGLVVMALLPIFFGSFRSVLKLDEQRLTGKDPETMTTKDAMVFPIVASTALFGLYVFFQVFSKEYINLLLTGYFFCLGVLALSHLLCPFVSALAVAGGWTAPTPFHLELKSDREEILSYRFTAHDICCMLVATVVGVWYLFNKHWIANNLFGIAFAINGVELLQLNNVATGCILLCGLFFYDIFWVFGTNVMVSVAKTFEAPIKLVFPQDLLTNGLSATNFAMLGLGDIVVPGTFIALLLRFDKSLKRGTYTYFYATFGAYFFGLLATIFVMHMFKHAQPALLYLVPVCLGTPLLLALLKGDLNALFLYEDHPGLEQKNKDKAREAKEAKEAKQKSN